jgi:uncharacterized protein (DUF1778 family)
MPSKRKTGIDGRFVENPRIHTFNVRLNTEERDALQRAADAEHLTPSAWLRRTAVIASRKAGG